MEVGADRHPGPARAAAQPGGDSPWPGGTAASQEHLGAGAWNPQRGSPRHPELVPVQPEATIDLSLGPRWAGGLADREAQRGHTPRHKPQPWLKLPTSLQRSLPSL